MKVNFLFVSLLSQKKSVLILFVLLLSFLSNLRAQCTGVSVFFQDEIAVCDNQNVVLKPVVSISTPSRTIDSVKWLFNGSVVSTRVILLVLPDTNIMSVNSFPKSAILLSMILPPDWVTNRTISLQIPGRSVPTAVITRC